MHRSTFFMAVLGVWLTVAPLAADQQGEATRHLPVLALPQVEPKTVAPSRVPVVFSAELSWAKAVLSERIPELLYQVADRQVAAGVAVDATVRRGVIDIRVRDDGATGLLPLDVDIAVKSRLGKMLLQLGRCHTTVDVELDVPLRLANDGTLPEPTTRATLRTPCRLSGFDVTPFLRYEIDQRLSDARDQISRHMGQANEMLKQAQTELRRHLAQASVGCVRLLPVKFMQGPITVDNGVVLDKIVAVGDLTSDCRTNLEASPRVEQLFGSAEFDLAWPSRLPLAQLRDLLAQRFTEKKVSGQLTEIRAVRLDESDQLAIYCEMPNARGWVFARPAVVGNTLALRSVTAQRPELLRVVAPVLESLAMPIDTTSSEILANQVLAAANEAGQGIGATPNLKARYAIREADLRTVIEPLLDREALIVVVRRRTY